jgi:hypothetical protein
MYYYVPISLVISFIYFEEEFQVRKNDKKRNSNTSIKKRKHGVKLSSIFILNLNVW